MKELLVQQEVYGAIDIDVDDFHEKASMVDKKKIETKTYTSILLNLSDKKTTSKMIFPKLDSFYLEKSVW